MKNKKTYCILLLFSIFSILTYNSCKEEDENLRDEIDLSGEWQFALDHNNTGIDSKLFEQDLSGRIDLPGTTDISKKGYACRQTSLTHLDRVNTYEGAAWYRKEVTIPDEWKGKQINLILERTKPTKIWVDGQFAGSSFILGSPQTYNLSSLLTPGNHSIAICVDNDLALTPYGNVHIYSDDTQTNWNGILGQIKLEATTKTHINDVRVIPDVENKSFEVIIKIANPSEKDKIQTSLSLTKELGKIKVKIRPEVKIQTNCKHTIKLRYNLAGNYHLWDEYRQPLYRLVVSIKNDDMSTCDSKEVVFGLRKFEAKGTQFSINDRVTFLRGNNDACVFPLTGHAPMDKESWLKVMGVAKAYGINHYRFHSWCPPEAAFEAADDLGIYLQVELPFWGTMNSGYLYNRLRDEGISILKNYGNHPSFVMFSMGNEISGEQYGMQNLMNELRNYDGRPLFSPGSNNNIGYSWPVNGAEFQVAARIPSAKDDPATHIRMSQSFADSKEGGLINSMDPTADFNYSYLVGKMQIPFISHEVGQYQIYPDYKEINKYTGVLRADNLIYYRDNLKAAGMADQALDFKKASGALAAICYRAEIEAALKTKGMAGYQLLDLQDYPGQGTSLVGILDAFMDSKDVISQKEWRNFSNDVVPMLTFGKFCWTNNENFAAALKIANYSNKKIKERILWRVEDNNKNLIDSGHISPRIINNGGLNSFGWIKFPLYSLKRATRLNIHIIIENTEYENSYPIWVYPYKEVPETPEDIMVTPVMNKALLAFIENGGKALLMPGTYSVYKNSVPGMFAPDFWNFDMFRQISLSNKMPVSPGTLGLLMNPNHPLFKDFPTDFHSNWQWWSIVKNSNSLILDLTSHGYRPIVQVIDNMQRNHKLGLIFEFKVGKGKLLVCMSRLNENFDKPEVVQLYNSIISYMRSNDFNPKYEINEVQLKQLIKYTVTRSGYFRTSPATQTEQPKTGIKLTD